MMTLSFRIELWPSIPLHFSSMTRSSSLYLNSVEVKLVSRYILVIFRNPVYTDSQQFRKSFHRFSAGLSLIHMTFLNPVSIYTIWKTALCYNHPRSIAIPY